MMVTFFVRLLMGWMLTMGINSVSAAEKPLPLISTTQIHRTDVVDAVAGKSTVGSPEFAFREGQVVRWFASDDNCALYVQDKAKYPDVDVLVSLAFFGADPVARFPKGVYDLALGPVVPGDMAHLTTHRGASYIFASRANLAAFSMDPDKYVPPVGGYCLGAMAAGRVTPGDPRNTFFVPEAGPIGKDGKPTGQWAVFGSPNGPVAWAAMTPEKRRDLLAAAYANYARQTNAAGSKVALR